MKIKRIPNDKVHPPEEPLLEYGGQSEETHAALEDDVHGEVLRQDEHHYEIQRHTETVHDGSAS